jgi:hypothetical protein
MSRGKTARKAARKSKARATALSDKTLDAILKARPYMTKDQMMIIEEAAGGRSMGYARRAGLAVLTQSVPKLRKNISTSNETAEAFADLFARLNWAIERHKEMTEMLTNASLRLLAAFTDRADAEKLFDAAQAEFNRPAETETAH